jgi:hypothetical protein
MVGVATVEATVTLRLKAVVLVTLPPTAVTVTGKLPVVVAPVVLTLNTVEHVGLQEAEEKDAVAPEGSPAAEKETDWALPDPKVAVMELVTEDPALTDLSPELESEKLKLPVSALLNHALASELELRLFLNALAFTRVLVARVKAPLYFWADCVGDWPSVV